MDCVPNTECCQGTQKVKVHRLTKVGQNLTDHLYISYTSNFSLVTALII